MNPENVLPASAEISVALLGFAAIASILRGGHGRWVPDGRFWIMLALATVALASSLLPLPMIAAGVDPATVWSLCSAALVTATLIPIWLSYRLSALNRALGTPTSPRVLLAFATPVIIAESLAILNSGPFIKPVFWAYLASLALLQFTTVLGFLRLLVVWLPCE